MLLRLALAVFAVTPLLAAPPPVRATYLVRLLETSPPRFRIEASLPAGDALRMDPTRPGDLPALLEHGWPALVSGLRVVDGKDRPVALEAPSAEGWRLPAGTPGPLTVTYEVRTAALAAAGWPAPREAVHVQEDTVSIVGRALFVTTASDQRSAVTFALPRGWRALTAWPVPDAVPPERLTENLLVLSRSRPEVLRSSGFTLTVVPLGAWNAVRGEIATTLRRALAHFVAFLPVEGEERYLAVLLPLQDQGAESYRQSMALTFPETPTAGNRDQWGNLLAHELFHYWNGWAMPPTDYARSQWFQEGFTEWAANTAVAADLPALERRLAGHVRNARRLATSMEETGGHKGPPLYSAGALVAFAWDVRLREATGGAHDLRDFLGALWRRTGRGRRGWEPADLVAALQETSAGPWQEFLDTYVAGTTPLPHGDVLRQAGLRLVDLPQGEVRVEEDPAATAAARSIRKQITPGR